MTIPLLPGHYYHIYNRGNNRENIFREARNYDYFLKLYARHVSIALTGVQARYFNGHLAACR